jgi:O-antigen ligase
MSPSPQPTDVQRTPGALLLAGAMLLCMPLVAVQGPGHTTPMDAVNALFLAGSGVFLLTRRERFTFPLAMPFWVIMVASVASLFTAGILDRAAVVVLEDVYLYLWFVMLAHFLARRCDVGKVAGIWTAVACAVALLTLADAHFGILGGLFSGMRRATGTFENPNMFGNYLVISFFVAWATAGGGRKLAYLALPLLFAGIRSTASNGALVAFLGGCGAAWAASSSFWTRRTLGLLAVTGALVLAVGGMFHEEIESAVVAQLNSARGDVGGAAMKGASERLPIWENTILQLGKSPLGVGPGNLSTVNAETTGDYHGAHNEYIGMLGERGVIGLAGWLGILGGVFMMLLRIRAAEAGGYRPLGVVQLFGLFGAIASHALVIELSHFRHFWMVLAVVAAASMQAAAVPLPEAEPLPGPLLERSAA